ncbi:MAG: recombinase [Hyphomonadaceae bacterium]|nr:recombinase [Clostridia bacterium]
MNKMLSDYENYEQKCKEIQGVNLMHLDEFEKWLNNQGLTKNTIDNHITNVDFYINEFLCYYDAQDVTQGCYEISEFLGDWFIRKATWSSCSLIKSNAASIKKFYAYLLDSGVVTKDDYDTLCLSIKVEMPEWLDKMKRYDEMDDDWD